MDSSDDDKVIDLGARLAKQRPAVKKRKKRADGEDGKVEAWPEFSGWSFDARATHALREVFDNEMSMLGAAKKYGLSYKPFRTRVHEERERRRGLLEEARQVSAFKGVDDEPVMKNGKLVPEFADFFWKYFLSGHPCPDCRVVHPVADFQLEIIENLDGGNLRTLTLCPPYHGKSTLITVWHTVYKIVCNRDWRRIIVSKATPLAEAFGGAIIEALTNPDLYLETEGNLIADFGPFDGPGSKFTPGEIRVGGRTAGEKDPNVLLLGWGAQVYGRRGDDIVFDDIADTINSANPEIVQKQVTRLVEYLSRIGRNSQAHFVGTRVNPGDIYGHLLQREGYKVIKFSCITDETMEETLWPEHFPYSAAIVRRAEMEPSSFQLIYQNVASFGSGNSFTEDMMEKAKDPTSVIGAYASEWRLFLGLDPAGAGKRSGVTAFTLVGVDPQDGVRHVIDHLAVKSMASWRQKEHILDWAARYPIYELIVEGNALQQQIFAQDRALVAKLAQMGTRVRSHNTGNNKWDPQTGVESIGPLMAADLLKIPWGNASTTRVMQPLWQELSVFPLSATTDRVMSLWFASLAVHEFMQRGHMPHFQGAQTKKWPNRIKKRRGVLDPSTGLSRGMRRQDETESRNFVNINAQDNGLIDQLHRPEQPMEWWEELKSRG